ncbi:thiol oxidoreductase [Solitalea longa]|uniref:Thiol oxidoreductase n=1 Tax=Solitalea longa TaxID=2079460 RepID=A0A2S5A1I0_9SPHI|nr:di-heme oxidoredictase family protein [Solitalea longa]POY36426.1 thiol oxidoreductase [Solitalea longa]
MDKKLIVLYVIIGMSSLLIGCEKTSPSLPKDDEILDGPLEGLTYAENAQFLKGDVAFNDDVFTTATGLGPMFVATSCGSCHAGDGKGHPFTTLTRFGQINETGNQYLHQGGPQLQNRAVPGFQPEQIPAGATFSSFTPPANTGLGFLDAVTDADIMAMADPQDANGDGISGIPNWIKVPAYATLRPNSINNNGKYIARFGKKAAAYDLMQQTANAYNQDMGITSFYESKDTYSGQVVDPEISNQTVLDVVFYLKTLKAPIQRNQNDPDIISGKQLFINIGCETCHKQELKTGTSPIAALANQIFHPYTDLLLHDMGPGLDDGYTEGSAKTAEWRTPPLWGLGLSKNSQGGQCFLLHDGRARSIEQAILLHGGEAQNSNDRFNQLTESEKQKLIKFLESL